MQLYPSRSSILAEFARKKGSKDKKRRKKRSLTDNLFGTTTAGQLVRGGLLTGGLLVAGKLRPKKVVVSTPSGGKPRMIAGRGETGAPLQVDDYMVSKPRTYKDGIVDGLRDMKPKVTLALPPGKKRGRGRPKKKFNV